MKRILITGKDSYIGTSFRNYLEQYPNEYHVEELDVRDDSWKEYDFTPYDVVFHVAGLAHIKEKKENEGLYYKVNRDLAYEIAKKAKISGVKQFIFMSSMSVYGLQNSKTPITKQTMPTPNTYYGKSKLEAEQFIQTLVDASYKICILRPPMVYGNNAPGNLGKLFKAIKRVRICPTIRNQRSAITIQKLLQTIKMCVDKEEEGTWLPQNEDYMCTYQMVREEMETEKIKVLYVSIFNPIIRLLIGKVSLISKCFGDLVYEK